MNADVVIPPTLLMQGVDYSYTVDYGADLGAELTDTVRMEVRHSEGGTVIDTFSTGAEGGITLSDVPDGLPGEVRATVRIDGERSSGYPLTWARKMRFEDWADSPRPEMYTILPLRGTLILTSAEGEDRAAVYVTHLMRVGYTRG